MRHFCFIFILSFYINSLFGAAAAMPKELESFETHIQATLAHVHNVANSYTQYLNELHSATTDVPGFCRAIGYPKEAIPDIAEASKSPALVKILHDTLTEDMGVWSIIKRVVKETSPPIPAIERAEVVLRYLSMEYFKFHKDTEMLKWDAKNLTKTFTAADPTGKVVVIKVPISPAEIFLKMIGLYVAREESETLQILASKLLASMPPAYQDNFSRHLPKLIIDNPSSELRLKVEVRRTKARILRIDLSNGYRLELPVDLNPFIALVAMSKISEEGKMVEEKDLCALQVLLSTGISFIIRNLPRKEVDQIVAWAKTEVPDQTPPLGLSKLYPDWESAWSTAQSKKAGPSTSSEKDDDIGSIVAPTHAAKSGKKAAKKARAKQETQAPKSNPKFTFNPLANEFTSGKAWLSLAASPPAPSADMAVPAASAPASNIIGDVIRDAMPPAAACGAGAESPPEADISKAVPATSVPASDVLPVAAPILLNPHQQAMLADFLRPTDATVHPWKRVVELIEALKGTPIGDAKLGLFIFPEGKIIKIYHPCFTKGETNPLAIQSLFRGLGEVGWTREALIAILPEAMQKPILAAEAKA